MLGLKALWLLWTMIIMWWDSDPLLSTWCEPTSGKPCHAQCSVVSYSATPWTVAHQNTLSMGFSRQEYWTGLPFPSGKHKGNNSWHAAVSMSWMRFAQPSWWNQTSAKTWAVELLERQTSWKSKFLTQARPWLCEILRTIMETSSYPLVPLGGLWSSLM